MTNPYFPIEIAVAGSALKISNNPKKYLNVGPSPLPVTLEKQFATKLQTQKYYKDPQCVAEKWSNSRIKHEHLQVTIPSGNLTKMTIVSFPAIKGWIFP